MDVQEAKTMLFGPKPTPDDQVIVDVLTRLWVSGQEQGYEEGKHAEMMNGTDDE